MLPELKDQSPGNAALDYYRVFSPEGWAKARQPATREKVDKALQIPLKSFPRDELRWLEDFKALREVDRAARREICDWGWASRVRNEGYHVELRDMAGLRDFGRLLAVRAQLEMAEGQYNAAIYTLQTGFALARHTGDNPTLVQVLVGSAIGSHMLPQIEELIQQPRAPNLYWALTVLPRPFLDLRKPIQGESLFFLAAFHGLAQRLENGPLSPSELESVRYRIINIMDDLGVAGGHVFRDRLALLGSCLAVYPEARRMLLAAGRKPEELDAMPILQVVLLAQIREENRHRDAMSRWIYLPYLEAQSGLRQAEMERSQAWNQPLRFYFLPLIPMITYVHQNLGQLDRRIAVLRCIEAIRMYAAGHDGKLPGRLADITEVPIPCDPMTGKSFDYKVDGSRATLKAKLPPGEFFRSDLVLNYELTLQP